MRTLRRLVLALALALAAAGAYAQDEEPCPNRKGLKLAPEELRTTLQAHEEWWDKHWVDPAAPGRAILCNVDLSRADLRGADLHGADLRGADLRGADLLDANLNGADLQDANLSRIDALPTISGNWTISDFDPVTSLISTNLQSVNLGGADLRDANLEGADLQGAYLDKTNLANARLANVYLANALYYASVSSPPNGDVAGIRGLSSVVVPHTGAVIGLVQLRKLLQEAGLPEEREATYSIERNKTRHLFFRELQRSEEDRLGWEWVGVRWDEPQSLGEGAFRWLAFELPVGYGLYPGRALWVLLAGIVVFALVYALALATGTGRVYRVWPQGRVEEASDTASLAKEGSVERLPSGGLRSFGHGLWFSVLSAFHLGFRELNVGNWLARLQGREYELRAVGWVRRLAGLQSLLSVYLLALWVLTYFGRPFG